MLTKIARVNLFTIGFGKPMNLRAAGTSKNYLSIWTPTSSHQQHMMRAVGVLNRGFRTASPLFRLIGEHEPVYPPKPMTVEEVEQRILKAIKAWDRFPHDRSDKLSLDAKFLEDLSFDSLDQVEILMAVEDEFELEIKEEDAEKFKTPRDVANFIIEYHAVGEDEV